MNKILFITGCSTGIGLYCAQALNTRGYTVIASCRKPEDVQKLLDLGIKAIPMDMNDSDSIQDGFRELMKLTGNQLDILINNAGYGQAGALEDIPREALRSQFETNVFGLMELTALAIPVMRRQGWGRIINLSSVLGIISMPFRGAYNASKYAVEGLSDTLRLELKSSGIKVISIEPGPIESQFRANAVDNSLKKITVNNSYFKKQYQAMLTTYKSKKNNSSFTQTPEAVLKKILKAIESKNPKAKYPVTFPAHLFSVLKRCLPVSWLDKVLLLVSRKELS